MIAAIQFEHAHLWLTLLWAQAQQSGSFAIVAAVLPNGCRRAARHRHVAMGQLRFTHGSGHGKSAPIAEVSVVVAWAIKLGGS